jgi:pectate lyase
VAALGGAAAGGREIPGAGGADVPDGGSSASGGARGGDDPCTVPEYIKDEPKPLGWAGETDGTVGGGSLPPTLITTIEQLKAELQGTDPRVLYLQGEFPPVDLEFGSNKTLVGCSPGAHLQGHLQLGSNSKNVIVRNVNISGYGQGDCALDPSFNPGEGCSSGSDAVSVNGSAHHIWFDHCTILDGTDGNLDITNDADFVTVSWTKFGYTARSDNVGSDATGAAGHRFSNLVGGTNTPPKAWPTVIPLNVTWHHNWWSDGVVERQPRVRFGRNHIFNNYYSSSVSNYCIRAGIEASLLLEGNFFDQVDSPHQFNNSADEQTAFIAVGDTETIAENIYVSTSGDRKTNGGGTQFVPPYDYNVTPAADVPNAVQTFAGPH